MSFFTPFEICCRFCASACFFLFRSPMVSMCKSNYSFPATTR